MGGQAGSKEPVQLWIWLGNSLTTLAAIAMLYYPRFEKIGRHLTLTLRGGGVIMLGLVALSFFVSRFGRRWDDLLSWERALILPAVCLGFAVLILAIAALLVFIVREGDLDLGGLGDFGGGRSRKADHSQQAQRSHRPRDSQD